MESQQICFRTLNRQRLSRVIHPTLNEIAVSVRHVLTTTVAQHAGLNVHLLRMQINEGIKNDEN